jgi:HEAT repeat protein
MFAPRPLPRTPEAAFRDLESAKPDVRRSAISDLLRIGLIETALRERVVLQIAQTLRDSRAEVRSTAALALADLRDARALPGLLVAVEDPDPYVREMAVSALGEIADPQAMPRIKRALRDERPELRYQATIAYVRMADTVTQAVVNEQGQDHALYTDQCFAIETGLADIDAKVRYIALRLAEERWKTLGESLSARIAERLQDSAVDVALAAALCLARDGHAEARSMLALVVNDGKVRGESLPGEDESEAIELAGAIGMRELIPALERRAYGLRGFLARGQAFHARIALARMAHPRASAEIFRELDSERETVRESAIVAAGRARMAGAKPKLTALRGRASEALLDEALALLALENCS